MVTNIIKSIIFGIVEGITEFLPISSTGHLILLDNILKLSNNRAFTNLFEIFIQSGAILSVIFVYFNKLWPLEYKKNDKKIKFSANKIKLWIYIIIAIIPFGIVGLFADDFIQEKFFNPTCVSITLIFYGIIFIIIEIFLSRKEKIEKCKNFFKKEGVQIREATQEIILDKELCVNCGLCVSLCFSNALVMNKETFEIEFDKNKCVLCGICLNGCPVNALKSKI